MLTSVKKIFAISEWLIQCNTDSCFEQMVLIYIYVWVYWSLRVLCVCIGVYDTIQDASKSHMIVSNLQ